MMHFILEKSKYNNMIFLFFGQKYYTCFVSEKKIIVFIQKRSDPKKINIILYNFKRLNSNYCPSNLNIE